MEPQDRQALLRELRVLAEAAGKAIMRVYDSDFRVDLKDDESPLTEADRASHRLICAGLAELSPRLPVLSEESSPQEIEARLSWERYWLVDPLDGTKEFVKRNGEFTVNIALVEQNRAVVGVVLAPALGLEYWGALGLGAWKRGSEGVPLPITVAQAHPGPLRVMGSRSHANRELAGYLQRLGPHELKPMGSSLKICLVAEGEADIYPRLGPTSEWDTAAAQAILESAGGGIIDLAGQPLTYNMEHSLLNPHFLAFGDHTRKRQWLAAVYRE